MRILVTGGCGFIGSHFVKLLLRETDWEVVVLDSLTYAGDANRVSEEGGRRSKVVWHDLRSPIPDRFGKFGCAVHMAAQSHVDNSIADPLHTVHNNVMGTAHFLEFCRRNVAGKCVTVSTDEVFGPSDNGEKFCEDEPYRPSSPYSSSKAAGDCLAFSWWRTYGLKLIGVHAMNNFGPGQCSEKFLPKVVKHLLAGAEVPVHAERTMAGWIPGRRTWIHAEDTGRAILYLLRSHEPLAYGRSVRAPSRFNIVGPRELDNLQVVKMAAEVLGAKASWRFVDYHSQRPGHDRAYGLDGSRLRELGWSPGDFDRQFRETVLALAEELK